MREKPGIAPGFSFISWTVAAYNAGGHNLKLATGYRKGIRFLTEFYLPTYFACHTSKIGLYDKHS